MKQVTQHNKTGDVRVEEVPIPALKPGFVLVRTHCSLISAGTERAGINQRKASLLQRAKAQPELVRLVLDQVRQYGLISTYRRVQTKLESTAPIGYSVAGEVVAAGGKELPVKAGDFVACAGANYANHAEYVVVPMHLCARIPKGVKLDDAAYTTLGSIALQGIRQVNPTLGETVVVIGLGLLGQLTIQMLKANGCIVVGIDLDDTSVKLARLSGADVAVRRDTGDVKNVVRSATKGLGADAVIITAATQSNDTVELAGELCREKGRVVLVGDVGLTLPRAPYYMKELDFRLSRSLGPGRYDPEYEERGKDYPASYVRWSENRNMLEFLRLLSTGQVDLHHLTTHRFPLDEAQAAYALITSVSSKKHEHFIGVLLDYEKSDAEVFEQLPRSVKVSTKKAEVGPKVSRVGFIGAGSFAQGFLLPHIGRSQTTSLVTVCNGNGLNATNVARTFGFENATSDPSEVFKNESINTVFIATRHNLHASLTVDALKSGKSVFVEKPLALNASELREIQNACESASAAGKEPLLMVGFNRRFAPQVVHARRFFENAVGPYVMQYRVSAGFVPKSHWTRDSAEGGGRIIGEVCHFVDLMQYITSSQPVKVFAESLSAASGGASDDDSVLITVKFQDGSVGTITYLANGDASLPKERLEISSTGRTAVIDNFQRLSLYQNGKKREFKLSSVDKGHRAEVREFLTAIEEGKPSPIPLQSLIATTQATFKIMESLQVGVPVSL
ncbi:MAG: bi-domain-containing oxidoreductase [Ignavibacteriales bacterium]|nr:bi-domain-containing oxidoreductase [Ignavibacteriales bacterium]